MSMSQEEIEALMSGAGDIALDEEEDASASSENESEENSSELEKEPEKEVEQKDTQTKQSDMSSEEDDNSKENKNTEDNSIESQEADESSDDDTQEAKSGSEDSNIDDSEDNEENYDDILAGIDGIVDDSSENTNANTQKSDKAVESDLKESIDENMYPMPMNNENKVVSQLNQVADDSEEKASRIFDVLSYILDENNDISNYNKTMGEFLIREAKLLNALSEKFPNIKVFQTNLELANDLVDSAEKVNQKINDENNKIFEAMELMQYHDINRQKIERVMAVIKKLNSYLNGIFEDETGKPEVQIAKHIPGDDNETVDAEDLEALINQFSEEEQSS